MTREQLIEAMARGMYGKHWDGPPDKMPGERMKEVWRKYCREALAALEADGWTITPPSPPTKSEPVEKDTQ